MKIRLAMVTALAVGCLAAALLWLMDAKVTEERGAALESGLRGSVSSLAQGLQADFRGLRRALGENSNLVRDRVDWKALKPFYAVAQVRFEGSNPLVQQFAADPSSSAGSWTTETLVKRLRAWGKNPAPDQGASLRFLLDSNKGHTLAAVWREGDKTWIAVTGPEFLQALLDLQKGPRQTLAVMNSEREILAHSTPEYVGTAVPQDSIYSRALVDGAARDYRAFNQGVNEPSMAAFEKVPRTDLTVLAFRPVTEIRAERRHNLLFGALAGAGLMLIAVSMVWSVAGNWEKKTYQEALLNARRTMAANPSLLVNAVPAPTPAALDAASVGLQKERRETSLRIASALGHELRGPLASILGFCQMVLSSTQDEKITEPVQSILRETRSARDVMDKLLAFAGEKNDEKTPGSVGAILARVLQENDSRFAQKRVQLNRDLREVSNIPLAGDAVEKALRHLFNNAIEATDRMMKKEISVRLLEEPREIRVEIQDNGEGIEAADLGKILDPFFTTRNPQQHLGLGLPATAGIMKEHGGELRIESTRGKGTTMTMVFPKPGKTAQVGSQQVVLRTEEKVEIPAEVPKPAAEAAPETPASPVDLDIDKLFAIDEPAKTAAPPDEDKTMVIAAEDKPAENAPSPAGPVDKPSFSPPKRESKLDNVKVDIRRPGARA
ncbi:MAG: hypothetical protein KF802_06180 [Bdellovibrionaceae bacterium]|nr:hypothetical protein [Pseudobdellovibrionaceae bacterium]